MESTKIIIYKGKKKEIPVKNPDSKLCENYIIAKMRYCKFEKAFDSEFCIYHVPDKDNNLFVDCPIDPSHRVLLAKLKKHKKVCNKLEYLNKLQQNPWFTKDINKVKQNNELTNLDEYYNLKWEDLDEEEYSNMLDKIIKAYNLVVNNYSEYSNKEKLQDSINLKEIDLTLSALTIDKEKDLNCTKGLIKSEKNGKQNEAIGRVLELFNLISDDNAYIEYSL